MINSSTSRNTINDPNPVKALRLKQVLGLTGLSRTHTYRLIARGDHPKPIQLSERVFVWNEADIFAWLQSKFGGV
jgi:prophage regulatory protein